MAKTDGGALGNGLLRFFMALYMVSSSNMPGGRWCWWCRLDEKDCRLTGGLSLSGRTMAGRDCQILAAGECSWVSDGKG